MSDDLVKRLRLIGERRQQCTACYMLIETADDAADRIQKLEAELHGCFHRIEELQAALRSIADGAVADNADDACYALMKIARKTLGDGND